MARRAAPQRWGAPSPVGEERGRPMRVGVGGHKRGKIGRWGHGLPTVEIGWCERTNGTEPVVYGCAPEMEKELTGGACGARAMVATAVSANGSPAHDR
jgi:hypothetical protein